MVDQDQLLEIRKHMDLAVVSTFETMAFMDVQPLEFSEEGLNISHILALRYTFPESGSLLIYLPKELKSQIVSNIFGVDWSDLNGTQIDDSLLELLNVLGGKFLNFYFGDSVRYAMNVPEMIFEEQEFLQNGAPQTFYYDAEGTQFKVILLRDET